jgi:hypothetical protein
MSTTSFSADSSHSGRMASIFHAFHIGPDPAIVARTDTLRAALATVRVDIDTRRFFIDLLFASGRHCASCSPLGKVGACGPTCSLLLPTPSAVLPGIAEAMTDKWMRNTISIGDRYDKIAPYILSSGYKVSMSTLEQWEQAVELLQKRMA